MYSVNGAMVYQVEYSEGTIIRVIESPGAVIRSEYKTADGWRPAGKPYIVRHDKKRQSERIKDKVIALLRADRS
jgi:hypothetical protein